MFLYEHFNIKYNSAKPPLFKKTVIYFPTYAYPKDLFISLKLIGTSWKIYSSHEYVFSVTSVQVYKNSQDFKTVAC